MVGGQLLATILVLLMIFTIIGIPFGIYFYIAWQFVQQEILFKDSSVRDALKGSHARVRGHWWRTILVTGFLFVIGVVTGPVLGFFLIFANLSADSGQPDRLGCLRPAHPLRRDRPHSSLLRPRRSGGRGDAEAPRPQAATAPRHRHELDHGASTAATDTAAG